MAQSANAPVVVAVNGSPASERAVDWAAGEARRRGRRLRLVYAFSWPLYHSLPRDLPGFDVDEFALRIVGSARLRALQLEPDLTVEAVHITSDPVTVLLLESQKAHMLVMGAHHRTAVDAVIPGSTDLEMLVSALCPIVIVPDLPPGTATGRILVGVDGSETARLAVEWAFPAADTRKAVLRAVTVHEEHAWWRFGALQEPSWTGSEKEKETAETEARAAAGRLLSDAIADERVRWPQVRVEEVVAVGHPAQALCAAAQDCDLMVVGSHGRGGFAGMLLGSVSRHVISHSPCPVAVVRRPRH
ncbi:universal stress protein [Nocardiopsis changdeensis]|uniref:Universal stress protein n=1 Tax=Nocardiopsis changdeensis TaxID=2831969 RepID=A0ABX8BJQ5_9ACTN|nr:MULTISPECIES: universal stress protein [Nocardiopsis]QUX20648.1 universal stress protein [Nocardiopsis changdeensis]QYX36580.1 universal stress protein [Nocardiopsis sp. MT53]